MIFDVTLFTRTYFHFSLIEVVDDGPRKDKSDSENAKVKTEEIKGDL